MKSIFLLGALLFSLQAFGESDPAAHDDHGQQLLLGYGFVHSHILSPTSGIDPDNGFTLSAALEKPIKFHTLPMFPFLDSIVRFNFAQNDGHSFYNYKTDVVNYTDTNVPYRAFFWTLDGGVKFSPLRRLPVLNPFVEVGGTIGFADLRYESTPTIEGQGVDPTYQDRVALWGYYWQAGIDFEVTKGLSLFATYRSSYIQTAQVDMIDHGLNINNRIVNIGLIFGH